MPTSVPGISKPRRSTAARGVGAGPRRARGFTLIELMVVVVIVGIAAAAVTIRAFPDRRKLLRDDAERLAQLFSVAQGEVRADGRRITWQADEQGYRFVRRARALTPGA
uniref:prepilin-type N-terminal cleavage/methylation domain-containing protein n=1 Tax=Pigmentiphaga sp. TaxID=1977564 RepID=UPI0025DEE1F4